MTVEDIIAKFKNIPPQLQKTIVLVLLVSVGGGYAYFNFLIKPNRLKIAKLTLDLDAQTKALDEAKKKAAQYEKFLREAATVESELRAVRERMPDEEEMPGYLESINRAIKVSGLSFLAFQVPTKSLAKPNYNYIPLTVNVTGDYHQLGQFLQNLASLKRVVGIGKMAMKKNATPGAPGSVSADITLNAYVFVSEQARAAASQGKGKKKAPAKAPPAKEKL